MKRKPQSLAAFFKKDNAPTQEAIAKKLGVTGAYVSLIASGARQPSLGLAIRISELTGVPLASLVSKEAAA